MPSTQAITYLREIELKYRITKIADPVIGKSVPDAKIVAGLFVDLQCETKEKFIVVNLDSQGKILCFEIVAIGSVKAIILRPMEVFRTAIVMNASSVILVHNHPSGNPNPSAEDIEFTRRCVRVADDLGLKVLDHVIIGVEDYRSLAELGFI